MIHISLSTILKRREQRERKIICHHNNARILQNFYSYLTETFSINHTLPKHFGVYHCCSSIQYKSLRWFSSNKVCPMKTKIAFSALLCVGVIILFGPNNRISVVEGRNIDTERTYLNINLEVRFFLFFFPFFFWKNTIGWLVDLSEFNMMQILLVKINK